MSAIRRLWWRGLYGPPIVVVSGLPRSGTSMAMRMLKAGGIPTVEDGQRGADIDNPLGYFEHERVMRLAEETDRAWLKRARGKAVKIISYLLKELPRHNNYRVILLEREIGEVLASQAKMLERRGEVNPVDDDKMAANYESLVWRVNYLLKRSPHLETLRLRYADVVADPHGEARRINDFLGGGLDVAAMAAVVDPNLYRNRAESA
ncbi:MAG: sulfotransferase domain-containing protein [Thermoanaerobaculia bacterium]